MAYVWHTQKIENRKACEVYFNWTLSISQKTSSNPTPSFHHGLSNLRLSATRCCHEPVRTCRLSTQLLCRYPGVRIRPHVLSTDSLRLQCRPSGFLQPPYRSNQRSFCRTRTSTRTRSLPSRGWDDCHGLDARQPEGGEDRVGIRFASWYYYI